MSESPENMMMADVVSHHKPFLGIAVDAYLFVVYTPSGFFNLVSFSLQQCH